MIIRYSDGLIGFNTLIIYTKTTDSTKICHKISVFFINFNNKQMSSIKTKEEESFKEYLLRAMDNHDSTEIAKDGLTY